MHKTLKRIGFALPSFMLAFTTLVTVPVFADHGSSDSTTTTSETSGSGSSDTSGSTSGTNDTNVADDNTTGTPETETELHNQGAQIVSELQKGHKGNKTDAEKTKACEAHKQGLETKFAAISKNADAFKGRIDDIFQKAQDYKATNNLSPANWDSLVAAATTAQTNAATAITNLKAVTPSLDCNNTSVAQDVATFKAAAQNTRDALKTYKAAVRAVLKSLLDLKSANDTTTTGNTSTTGGNQ